MADCILFYYQCNFHTVIGKLSDLYGRKFLYLIGLALVVVSSILAPLSPNMPVYSPCVVSKQLEHQTFPSGIGIIRNTISKNQNRVIGTLLVFATTSAAFGPTISGLLIPFGGWPIIFYVNLPVLAIVIVLSLLYIPKDERTSVKAYKLDYLRII